MTKETMKPSQTALMQPETVAAADSEVSAKAVAEDNDADHGDELIKASEQLVFSDTSAGPGSGSDDGTSKISADTPRASNPTSATSALKDSVQVPAQEQRYVLHC